jgi:1-acyl-sn-glycerol-3-phosphate acyltransferase
MIAETLSAMYLLWPLTVAVIILSIIVGLLIAFFVGSLAVGGAIAVWYVWTWLKDEGYLAAAWGVAEAQKTRFQENLAATFQVRGEIPKGPVLYIAHPHGLFSMAPFLHWSASATAWPTDRPVRIAMHSIFFKIPVIRELMEMYGNIQATEPTIRTALERGESVALLTGGIQELQLTAVKRMRIVLKKRKGFLRIARDLKVPIIPVLTFGENELFPPSRGPLIDFVQRGLKNWFGIAIPVPTVESIGNWFNLLSEPLTPPVVTWVGKPIKDPTHEKVLVAMTALYKEGKPEGYGDLEIL